MLAYCCYGWWAADCIRLVPVSQLCHQAPALTIHHSHTEASPKGWLTNDRAHRAALYSCVLCAPPIVSRVAKKIWHYRP
jgi:hypothetical protein